MSEEPITTVGHKAKTTPWSLPLFETKADAVKILASTGLGVWAAYYCFSAAARIKSDPTASILLCIFSGLLGWILGIFVTPSSTGEKSQFSEYGKTIAAAATGFFAGQFNGILEFFTKYFSAGTTSFDATPGLLAGCCFLLGLLSTFIFRSYVRGDADEVQGKRAKATAALREAVDKLAAIDRNGA